MDATDHAMAAEAAAAAVTRRLRLLRHNSARRLAAGGAVSVATLPFDRRFDNVHQLRLPVAVADERSLLCLQLVAVWLKKT